MASRNGRTARFFASSRNGPAKEKGGGNHDARSPAGHPVIVAMSGTVDFDEPQPQGFSRSDFDLFVQKPINFSTFWAQLEALCRA